MKMGFVYEAAYSSTPSTMDRQHLSLHYADNNYPGHAGWKEIVALPRRWLPAAQLRSHDRSQRRAEQLSNRSADAALPRISKHRWSRRCRPCRRVADAHRSALCRH